MANYLISTLYQQVEKFHDREFCRFKLPQEAEWRQWTWAEFLDQTEKCARALYAIGCEESAMVAICTPNRPEALEAEFGCFFNRQCVVPIYAYSSQEQYDFIVKNCGARVLIAGSEDQYVFAHSYAQSNPDGVDHIILLFDKEGTTAQQDSLAIGWSEFLAKGADKSLMPAVMERADRGLPEDLASLIYTSGTTGDPKGVMIIHSNYEAAIREHLKRLPEIQEQELSMCFLPISHIFEKAWTFFCMAKGLRIAFNYDPRAIEKTLPEVRPNLMCCVPRFWEKVYTALIDRIYHFGRFQRMMTNRAIAVGAKVNLHYRRLGMPVPWLLQKEYDFWDKKIFSVVREKIGIPSPNFFPTAGAALSDKICGFMRKMGIDLIFGYGMTETTATVSCFPQLDYQIGTVGTPMPMVSVKISDDGEILVKGPTVTPGYYNAPEANAAAFTADGYLRTGDCGFINEQGALVLTHRKKDLFKTSNGKYISPQATESLLASDPYIEQAAVIGDRRKYVTALIVPNFSTLRRWAESQGILNLKRESLCDDPKVKEFYMKRIAEHQKEMAGFEKIKKITLLSRPFTQESGEVTNTLKLRRRVIETNFAKEITDMYPNEYLDDAPVFPNRHR